MNWKSIKQYLPPLNKYVIIHYIGGNWKDNDDDPNFVIAKFEKKDSIIDDNTLPYIFRPFGPGSFELDEVDYWCEFDRNFPK